MARMKYPKKRDHRRAGMKISDTLIAKRARQAKQDREMVCSIYTTTIFYSFIF